MDLFQIILPLGAAVTLVSMAVGERLAPARPFPFHRHWLWIGIGVIVVLVGLGKAWSLVIPKQWLRQHRLIDGEPLGIAGGLIVWYPLNTFVSYWYHRFQHRSSLAWRLFHQLHHGVPRVDIPSALIAHPLDVIVSTTLSMIVTGFFLGLNAHAVALASVLQFFIALFPHWNVDTPKWTGYIVQRPEEHILHHERGVHSGNYSDWPFWDKLFRTYRAPIDRPIAVGFERSGWAEQLKMLAFIDVNVESTRPRAIAAQSEKAALTAP